MSNKYKILVIEDENNIRNFIETVLSANDYQTLSASTCEQGLLMYASHIPDLVMLDLGLPDRDGIEFIQNIRQTDTTPIIVLSARTGEKDKIEALDLGANDYITKPFGTGELLARVRATLRNNRPGSGSGSLPGEKFTLYDLTIDYDRRIVYMKDEEIKLTQTEYNILALLSYHTGKVMTYASIIKEIWGCSDDGSIKKLQVNMANIRKKLGSKPGDNQYIINELGVGYRMNEENL
ncbi:MAG: response regulator transcription factor [Lachnospiraceae bacterium]|nr:response regulator transcription factor [Lachnospiraceae bacterium]